jgi:hypothetical protein
MSTPAMVPFTTVPFLSFIRKWTSFMMLVANGATAEMVQLKLPTETGNPEIDENVMSPPSH